MKQKSVFKTLHNHTWIWICAGSLLMWILTGIISRNLNFTSLQTNTFSAAFLILLALGQMFVVTTGKGAIDLSIPGVVTLAAYLNMIFINGRSEMLLPGVIIIILAGIMIGLVNSTCVVILKMPPIIATLAVNYILCSLALFLNTNMGLERLTQADFLLTIARGKLFGIYIMIYIVIITTAIAWFVLNKTTFGKSLIAIGQNEEAAHYAGTRVNKVLVLSYVLSSVLGSLAGLLISVRVSGAFLGMGDAYLLETIAGVVLGGTLMSGGKPNTIGTFFGCLFLTLLVTAMRVADLSSGMQNVLKGLLIIFVIIIGTPSRKKTEQL
ncbi:ABC transporter permease [Dethiosulfatarculus sandiegensis]|uniref:Branched-chain amino acid ABC transporter permease n=1 Tax=Dethiosulfatarculus sandiegensis TaxID=1429043 RepID=A0A0D2JDK4_9BACT|nr:ABC transporter permease [Dethiosulfatarculus sandiegensis]KIX13781.1 branched-chain amino acid ABC transporter permease [Dethiosulfatarculus sandiegensis]